MKKAMLVCALMLGACTYNRVHEVQSVGDTKTVYKVPVVYGIGIAEKSKPFTPRDFTSISFMQFDLPTKGGTAECVGIADTIELSFGVPFEKFRPDDKMHYHVLMVPAGYYALSTGIKPAEANPSLYFKIEKGHPQYLGDFWITKVPTRDDPTQNLMHVTTLPVEYHIKAARAALQKFNIEDEKMSTVKMVNTDSTSIIPDCIPNFNDTLDKVMGKVGSFKGD